MDWYLIDINEALDKISSQKTGLTTEQAAARLKEYGPNEILAASKKSAWFLFISQFKDFMILILAMAAIISGIAGNITDTIVILTIVALNGTIGFIQEYRAEKAIEGLKKMAAANALVLRNNALLTVAASTIVPGDIILLEAGSIVPADAKLIHSTQLKVNESSLTGESFTIEKNPNILTAEGLSLGDQLNMVFKGTQITGGRATGVVVATGMNTHLGRIASLLQEPGIQTPLQKRLSSFGKTLAYIILFICALIFTFGYLRGEEPLIMFLTAVSLAVAAIPEALPAVIAVALASGAKKLVRKNALVRKISAVETLGSVTYICTDKTGTLTLNKMTVEKIAGPDLSIYNKDDWAQIITGAENRLLMQAMALNNHLKQDEQNNITGDPTETALYEFAFSNGYNKKEIENEFPLVAEITFDAERKCMTTIHRHNNKYIVFVKGAVEVLIKKIGDVNLLKKWEDINNAMLDEGLRVLGFATKELDELPAEINPATIETGLKLIGITGIIDPPRQEAFQAVFECKTAGIKPVMITGDHPVTAASIAKKLGILNAQESRVITGAELHAMSEKELQNIVTQVSVYARVSPEQKLDIVKALQKKGEYVAMTGDGVNDAPALKHADIGVAMSITGTDVSKEAAHMILLDDNFATIVKAIKEGRRIFDNIRKFIRYILTGNSAELWTIFLAPFFGLPIPLLPIHILWINLVTDGLPGLALVTEPGEKNIMHRPPRLPDESIFANGLGVHIIWVGLLLAGLTLGTQAFSIFIHDTHWQTMVFTVLCWGQLMHVMAIRSENTSLYRLGIFSNKPLTAAVTLTLLLQLAIIYLPAFNTIFKTQPLSIRELCFCIATSSIILIAVEIEKILRRRLKAD